ncbi:MAG: flagellar biosynthetic protein FliR [Planctomycetes bacterium]|nr:flagellar biosynthetic protein FliR [Planctomycetota bacterium]
MEKIVALADNLPVFALVFFRTAGILVFAPIYKDESIPIQLKVGLSMLVAFVMYPTIDTSAVTLPTTFWSFVIVIIKEAVLGIIIGYVANLIFSAFLMGGDLVGRQMGLDMGSVVDPQLETESTSIAVVYYIIAALVFLSLNGHHWFIKAISISYNSLPIGQINYSAVTVSKVTSLFRTFFTAGATIAAPCLVILMLALMALGLTARVAPQVNVFLLAFPVKILLGFGVIAVSLPFLIQTIKTLLVSLQREIPSLFATMY